MNKALLIVLVLLMSASAAHACIWDRDTLAMERARFPEVNELIVGYFPRHSPAYYEWRKEQVLAIPVDERTPSDYDDLGASYDKLGEHEQAIQTILDKMQRYPDTGVYESLANLGTFYIHNGELEKGAEYIGKAIEINPDAHFGREVYQKLLVEYVIARRALGQAIPLEQAIQDSLDDLYSRFDRYVLDAMGFSEADYQTQQHELKKAIKGILGMMRFGSHDSPILLEALGDLLDAQDSETGSQRLAARAYLKAAYETDDADSAARFRDKARSALISQQSTGLAGVEALGGREGALVTYDDPSVVRGVGVEPALNVRRHAGRAQGLNADPARPSHQDDSARGEVEVAARVGPHHTGERAVPPGGIAGLRRSECDRRGSDARGR